MIEPPKILFKSCTHTICCHVKGLQDLNNTSRRPKHKIKAFFVPSDWNHTKLYHDIALVFVAPSINLTGTDIGSIVLDDTDPEGFKLPSIIIKGNFEISSKKFSPLFRFIIAFKIPITTTYSFSDLVGTKCTMIGWGDMHGNQTFSQKLQEAEVPIRNLTECRKNYALLGQKMDMVRDHNICAGMLGKDSCYVRLCIEFLCEKKIALFHFQAVYFQKKS